MPLYTNLLHRIDGYLREFCEQIHEHHPEVGTEELMNLWQTITKPRKRTTRYHFFLRQERVNILRDCPKASFGDISRECSRRWKLLSNEERLSFPLEKKKTDPSPPPPPPVVATEDPPPPPPPPVVEVVKTLEERKREKQEREKKEFLEKYRAKSFQEVYKIAKNWFEDEGVVDIRSDMSKEEMIELLMKEFFKGTPVVYPVDHPVWKENIEKPIEEIMDLVREERPWYRGDPVNDLKEDILYFLVKLREEHLSLPPIEVHPFYYELRAKPMTYLYELCERTFYTWNKDVDWRSMDRKKLTRVLVRNFDDVIFPEEEEQQQETLPPPPEIQEKTTTRRRKRTNGSSSH